MILEFDDKEYKKLIDFAASKLFDYPHLDARDIVNEVLMKHFESEENVLMYVVKKEVYDLVSQYSKGRKGSLNPLRSKVTNRICKKCNEIVPLGGFYFVKRKATNQENVIVYCKECFKAKMAAYFKKRGRTAANVRASERFNLKNKHTKKFKESNKDRQRRWRERQKGKSVTP